MKIKVAEATGSVLDWLVAKCEGINIVRNHPGWAYIPKGKCSYYKWTPTTNWKQGGPIVEREVHNLFKHNGGTEWCCAVNAPRQGYVAIITADGATPLIAAMRCYVASKLGDEAEVPDELREVK